MSGAVIGKDKVVALTYTLRDERGQVVEQVDVPVPYLHGHASGLFDKLERSLEGRRAGDSLEVTLTPEEGFGPHDPALTFTDDVENVPPELRRLGAQLDAQNARGEVLTFTVTHIDHGRLTVDANHPLAGQTVQFRVTVCEVRDATPDELRADRLTAVPAGPLST
jgi:FKBP-type peptidyl-prolyl cis-trans isomerase SlyD